MEQEYDAVNSFIILKDSYQILNLDDRLQKLMMKKFFYRIFDENYFFLKKYKLEQSITRIFGIFDLKI
jgi:hypothetical protein